MNDEIPYDEDELEKAAMLVQELREGYELLEERKKEVEEAENQLRIVENELRRARGALDFYLQGGKDD